MSGNLLREKVGLSVFVLYLRKEVLKIYVTPKAIQLVVAKAG